jgi:hypothetical protein
MAKRKAHASKSKKSAHGRRNPYAFDPIMRKGGAHEKSTGAKRADKKRETKDMVNQWRSDAPSRLFCVNV